MNNCRIRMSPRLWTSRKRPRRCAISEPCGNSVRSSCLNRNKSFELAMRDILTDLTQTIEKGRPCVFCSVVETRGSTPQKAGAAMIVHADGGQSGTLGGGCVEAEVKRRALGLLNEPQAEPEILRFN